MQVCTGLYLPKPGACLQLSGEEATQCQSLARKTHASRLSGGIKYGDMGILNIWISIGGGGSGMGFHI